MSIDGFPFEGRDVTARQLRREGFAYSDGTLQSALEAGCQTVADLVAHCERKRAAGQRRSGIKGRAAIRRAYGN